VPLDGTSVVDHEVWIDAAPDTVFAYFTDPAKMVQWMGIEATLDPRPGGITRIAVNSEAIMRGEFVEVDPPERVVFTWGWEDERFDMPPASSLVEVSLAPDADGTRLRVVHQQVTAAGVEFHQLGWVYYIGRLALSASGREPGPDPWADARAARRLLNRQGPEPRGAPPR
jgi:uncharacterized protein YndB with AHSA1/START domain